MPGSLVSNTTMQQFYRDFESLQNKTKERQSNEIFSQMKYVRKRPVYMFCETHMSSSATVFSYPRAASLFKPHPLKISIIPT
jgi:3-mercaptopyruvate sulfurtransferase SseA